MEKCYYTVCGWYSEKGHAPDIEEFTTSFKVAEKKARSLGRKLPKVEVRWHRKSDGQVGYFNKHEGHSLTGSNWSTLKTK